MAYYLDTNICIYALKGIFPSIQDRLQNFTPEEIKIPSMVKAELLVGAKKSLNKEQSQIVEEFLFPFEVVPFDNKATLFYADFRATLEKKGFPIGANDLIIAATTSSRQGVLITHNVQEFSRLSSLQIEDWTQSK